MSTATPISRVAAWATARMADQLIIGYGFGDPVDDQAGWDLLLTRAGMPCSQASTAATHFANHGFLRCCAGVPDTASGVELTRTAVSALARDPECRRDLQRLVDTWTQDMISRPDDASFRDFNGDAPAACYASALTVLAEALA